MPHTITRKALRQNIIKRLYRGRYPIISTTTSTAGDTSEIIDTVLLDGDFQDYGMKDTYVLIVETVGSGPVYGEARKLIGLADDNQFQTHTAFSLAVQTGTDYELHYRFHPFVIDDKIDRIIEELRVPTLIPLSIVPNPDFSQDDGTPGTPDDWISVNSTFVRTSLEATGDEDFMFLGSYNNVLTATSSGAYLSTVIATLPGKSYVITVPVMSNDLDKIIVSFESPTNTVIASGSTSWPTATNLRSHSVIQFTATTPADRYNATIKISLENDDSVARIPFVIVMPIGDTQFDKIMHRGLDLRDSLIVTFPLGEKIEHTDSSNNFTWMTKRAIKYSNTHNRFPDYHGGLRRITLERPSDGTPLFLVGERPFTPIAASATYATRDAFKTQAPAKLVEYLVVKELLEEWAEQEDQIGHSETASRLYSRAQDVKAKFVAPESRRVFGDAQAFIRGTL